MKKNCARGRRVAWRLLTSMPMNTKVFWLFGRSGAGKTTLARRLCGGLENLGLQVIYLDGDELRATLCSDLGFSPAARLENHRRIAAVAAHLRRQGFNVVVSTMAPERRQRDLVAQVLGEAVTWIYVHASLGTCMERDPKGLYQRELDGRVKGLSDYPFDQPRPHECRYYVDTELREEEACYHELLDMVKDQLVDFAI